MKKLFFATAILLTAITTNAQNSDLKFQGGLDLGIPAHNLSGTSLGVGVDVMALYPLSKEAVVTGDFGYTALFGKNGATTTNLLPLRAGLRFYPSDNFLPVKSVQVLCPTMVQVLQQQLTLLAWDIKLLLR
jgi:hypothetical protein